MTAAVATPELTKAPRRTVRPQPGPQERFLASSADVVLYGGGAGGGKSFALLLDPLRHVHLPRFEASIFRRTTPEITNGGGLWDESEGLYPDVGGAPRIGSLSWTFPSKATIRFNHMEHEADKRRYQGAQFAYIGFDELTHFTAGQFWYLLSRNRSTCGVKPYIRATCNPDADSWVASLVSWWIDADTGYPIRERCGVVRWFLRIADELHWADSREACRAIGREHGLSDEDNLPKSFTFIAASLDDNPALVEADPGYRANLLGMPSVERERLLRGNWKIRSTDGAEWGAELFAGDIFFDEWPEDDEIRWRVMSLDPSLGKDGKSDYSAYVMTALGRDGLIYVDAQLRRRNIREIVKDGLYFFREFMPDIWAIETNGFNSLVELIHELADGVAPNLAKITQHRSKIDRIRIGLNGPISTGQLRYRRDSAGCALLLEQLRSFPMHKHDDGPDSLDTNLRVLNDLVASERGD